MIIYWLMVAIPLLIAAGETSSNRSKSHTLVLAIAFVLFWIMGFRETCGDFYTYNRMFERFEGKTLFEYMSLTEPLYGLFSWTSAQLGWGIYGVNIFCAIVFLTCLYRAALREPLPVFFTALAVPYFVIVVGMGYTRQGVAAALLLLGIQSLRFKRPWNFTMYIILGAGFHASVFAALPAVLFGKLNYKNRNTEWLVRFAVVALGAYGAYGFFREQYGAYIEHYVESSRYSSTGALLRTSVSGAAAVFFLMNRRKWREHFGDDTSLLLFALIAIASVPLSLIASTPVDRVGLYLIPFQIIVFGRLPLLKIADNKFGEYKFGISCCYVAYFFVWLHLGANSQDLWVPYLSALW